MRPPLYPNRLPQWGGRQEKSIEMCAYGTPLDEGDLTEQEAREVFCEIGRRCYAKNFIEANGGNFSYRMDDGRILATPTMISKGFMEPADLVILDLDGNQLAGKRAKTSEILMHLTFYRNRPEVRSVIHAHPRHACAFAITKAAVPKCVMPEVEIFVGEVPITSYETPGTPKLSAQLMPVIRDFNCYLLANHGAVTLGTGIMEAFWRMEILDAYCQVVLLARGLGEISQVTDQHMLELFQIKERMGFPDRRLRDPVAARCDVPPPIGEQPVDSHAAPAPANPGGQVRSSVIGNPSPEVIDMITKEVFAQLRGRGLL